MKVAFFLTLLLCFDVSLAYSQEITNPYLLHSPWSQGHRTDAMQASSPYLAPYNKDVLVQRRYFEEDSGHNIGTSPWLILSEKKYQDKPNARTLWGASLGYVFKYIIDGETFHYINSFRLDGVTSISWNLIGLHDEQGGRIIVPQPMGLTRRAHKNTPCYGRKPALLVFRDGSSTDSPIQCEKKFEFEEDTLRKICQPPENFTMGYSAAGNAVLPTGEIMVKVQFKSRWYSQDKQQYLYAVILDNQLTHMKQCALIDTSMISNNTPVEYLGNGYTALYFPTNEGIVKLRYHSPSNQLEHIWKQAVPFRERTGTTPTLLDAEDDKLIIVVDGKCAVTHPLTGRIGCSGDTSPSRLYAIRRDVMSPYIVDVLSLPPFIRTIENSPSALGDTVVVADYGGYKPTRDSGGVVAAQWNAVQDKWELLWQNPLIQMNGVTSISAASNMVYSSGMEADDNAYLYGITLHSKGNRQAGTLMLRQYIGSAEQHWDAGNNTVINDDKSVIYCTNKGLVRVLQQ